MGFCAVVLGTRSFEDYKVERSKGGDASCDNNDVHFRGTPHKKLDGLPCDVISFGGHETLSSFLRLQVRSRLPLTGMGTLETLTDAHMPALEPMD